MTVIASPHNQRLKALRRLQTKRARSATGLFAAEGEDLVAAAQRAGRPAVEGFCAAGSGLGGPAFAEVRPQALAAVSALGSGTRVIGVYEQRWQAPAGPLCVYLHGVADPGNVGTVLRSAGAFGAACVALGPGCADPHSPKAVRASMGAIFGVRLARVDSPLELPGRRVALDARAPERLQGPWDPAEGELSLLVGAEREGLPPEVLEACEERARIAIEGDSLNAAMAATVALYEMTRGATLPQNRSSRVPTS